MGSRALRGGREGTPPTLQFVHRPPSFHPCRGLLKARQPASPDPPPSWPIASLWGRKQVRPSRAHVHEMKRDLPGQDSHFDLPTWLWPPSPRVPIWLGSFSFWKVLNDSRAGGLPCLVPEAVLRDLADDGWGPQRMGIWSLGINCAAVGKCPGALETSISMVHLS